MLEHFSNVTKRHIDHLMPKKHTPVVYPQYIRAKNRLKLTLLLVVLEPAKRDARLVFH